jgi:hypothetical protein
MLLDSQCLEVDHLNATIFNDVCVATDFLGNTTAFSIVQAALKTCCGPDNVFTIDNDCYTYCNITTPFDTVMLNNCLLDTLDPDTSIDFDCFPSAWELSSTMDTTAGKIATTWTYPDQTWTETASNGAVTTQTYNYWGELLTGTAASPGSMATKTTGTAKLTSAPTTGAKSTSTTASPTVSKSSGGLGIRLSYKTGVLVALLVLGHVL